MKNKIVDVKIEKIVFGGESIGKINDKIIFVPMGLPGDELKVRIISEKKDYCRGLIEQIIKPSKDRILMPLKSFEDFSGCDFANMSYEKQLYYKSEIIKETLSKMAKVEIDDIKVIPSEKVLNYRNKVAEPFVKINGEIKTGFFQKKSHEIFTTEVINLRSESATELLNQLLNKLNNHKGTKKEFKVYNDINKSGFLKTCVIRNNEKGQLMLIVVVTSKSSINRLSKLLQELYEENNNLKSVYISLKEKEDNVIFGENFYLVSGKEYIDEEIFDIKFKIYPDSFFQINKKQAEKIYSKVLELLGDYNDKVLIDAFSGTGTISLILSKKAKYVYGIEMVSSSVKSAIKTSKENNIKNTKFINLKVEEALSEIMKKEKVDYIVFDPPRKGISESVLREVIKEKISKIIYISCNLSTFSRDVKILQDNGYKLEFIEAYDMFPQTHHIEMIGLLQKKDC